MNDYIKSQSKAAKPIMNEDLICRLCKFKGTKAAYCEVYKPETGMKPNKILKGSDECDYFEPEDL